MKREEIIRSLLVVGILMLSSVLILNPANASEDKIPTRAQTLVYFSGSVMNLTAENIGMFGEYWLLDLFPDNNTVIVENTDFMPFPPVDITKNSTWYNPNIIWNTSTYSFEIEFDIDPAVYTFDLDNVPWKFTLMDRYGYNRSYGGSQSVTNYALFENFTSTTGVELENNSLEYIPGVFGDISFTILNGSSMEPLEGVGFSFTNHPYHSSVGPTNRTDENGNITFTDLQLGLEVGLNKNKLEVYLLKDHFNTQDGTGILYPLLYEGNDTHYTYVLKENKRVKTLIPSDGATDVTANRTRAQIQVEFFEEMDEDSVNMATLYLENQTSIVPVDYQWNVESTLLALRPLQDLEYDALHTLTITTAVENGLGARPIWRNDHISFTTELHPGWIEGVALVNGTADPAPAGSTIYVDGSPIILDNGYFKVTGLGPGLHSVETRGPTVNGVMEYLYYGMDIFDVNIEKGDELALNDLFVTKRAVIDLTISIDDPGLTRGPVEGVSIVHRITMEEEVTDTEGKAVFSDILADYTTYFDASKEHYGDKLIIHTVPAGQVAPMNLSVDMKQVDLPVEVSYWTAEKRELEPGSMVDVYSYFSLDFAENMDIETMTTDTIWIRQIDGELIPTTVKNDTMNYRRWYIRPRDPLPYDGDFELVINDTIADDIGFNPFWKNYRVTFKTPSLSSAAVEGKVSVNGRGVGGIDIAVMYDDTVLSTGMSGENGAYLFEVPLTSPEMTPIRVVANGSIYGLSTNDVPFLTLRSGSSEPVYVPEMNLTRLPGWFSYSYDEDYQMKMAVDGTIVLEFKHALGGTTLSSFPGNFTLKISSTPEELNLMLSEDRKTVTIDPVEDLQYETTYIFLVSYFEEDIEREMRFEDGGPALIRGEKISITTSLKPIKLRVMDPRETVDISPDQKIKIYFENHTVDQSRIEEALEIKDHDTDNPVDGLIFTWSTEGKNLEVSHDLFDSGTTYVVTLPVGVYGDNNAKLFSDFEFIFTTSYDGNVPVDFNPPGSIEPKSWSTTLNNPRGKPIEVTILIRVKDSGDDYVEIVNVVIPGLGSVVVELDFTDYGEATYEIHLEITDQETGNLMDTQSYNLNVEEDGSIIDSGGLPIWAIIIVVLIILVVIGLAGYLYISGRNKEDIEETHEEFECPECHNIVSDNDTVCPNCGAEFEEEAYKCPKCSAMLEPEDDTCSECGYDFSDQDQMELEDEDEDDEDEFEEDEPEDDEVEEGELEELDEEDEEMEEDDD